MDSLSTVINYSLLAVFSIGSLLLLFVRLFHEYFRKQFKKQNINYVATPSPVLYVQNGYYEYIEDKLLKENDGLFGCSLYLRKTIYTIRPELVQLVCNKEFTNFVNRRPFQNTDRIFSRFLFFAEDDEWKRVRAILTPIFSIGKLRRLKEVVDDTVTTMLKNTERLCKQDKVVNTKDIMGSYTLDTIIQTGFGVKVDSLVDQNHPITSNVKKLFSVDLQFMSLVKHALISFTPKLSNLLGVRINMTENDLLTKIALDIISKKRQEMKLGKNTGKHTDMISLMLEAEIESNEEGERKNSQAKNIKFKKYITNEEMIANSVMFFSVGYDTTASLLMEACYYLAANPDKQEILYSEVETLMEEFREESEPEEDPIKLVTYDRLSRFQYLNGVINETLRLSPPATIFERRAVKDIHLETADKRINLDMKKGDILRVGVYSMHRDPKHFPEPEKFLPERFIGEPTFHKYAFVPFGSGPRNCIARSLALMEAKLALLHFVRCFKLSLAPQTKPAGNYYYQFFDIFIARENYLAVEPRE